MILADYPGNMIAGALVVGTAVFVLLAYKSQIVRSTGWWRVLLGILQYACIVLILLVIWNPSLPTSSSKSSRNTVLAVFDTSESMSISDDAKSTRLDRALEAFQAHFNPADPESPVYLRYGFDSNCYASSSQESLKRWGSRTNMHSVSSLLERFDLLGASVDGSSAPATDASRVVGAVVFTDGQAEDKNVQSYFPLASANLKVLLVGVGSDKVPPDVAVSSIRAPARVAIETTYDVEVQVTARGIGKAPVSLALFDDDALIDLREIRIPDGAEKALLTFRTAARRLGSHRLSAQAHLVQPEQNTANNERDAVLQVIDAPRLKVLLYSQVANSDFGKVRSSLERDRKIDLDIGFDAVINPDMSDKARTTCGHVPLPTDAEGFYAYDVIILGPCNFNKLTLSQVDGLYSFVTERGGGIILLPGRDEFSMSACKHEKILTLLPVELEVSQRAPVPAPGPVAATPEGLQAGLLAQDATKQSPLEARAYYGDALKKPASAVLVEAGNDAIVSVQRAGRGRVCLVNTYGLFRWYREDLEGGALRNLMSSLTADAGRITSGEASLELFASRDAKDMMKVRFDARVYDRKWAAVEGATVLLDFAGETLRMEEASQGHYSVLLEDVRAESILARAQAEKAGTFIGERTLTASLPCPRQEMDRTELDRKFLKGLASRLGVEYRDLDDVDDDAAGMFPKVTVSYEGGVESAWQRWSLLVSLCVLLSTLWFIRRGIGLI